MNASTHTPTADGRLPRLLAPSLAALVALAPLSLDTYLPALPSMAGEFGATMSELQRSVSSFLIGLAVGQLMGGPISDRIGRVRVATIGLSVFLLSTLAIMFATSVPVLVALRFTQAMGGGAATVISAAMVRDLFHGRAAARVMSMIATLMLGAPLVAPVIGSLVLEVGGWRAIFGFLIAYGFVMLAITRFALPETVRPSDSARPGPNLRDVFAGYRGVLSNPRAVGFLLAQAAVSGELFSFITTAPFVFMDRFGVPPAHFPLYFGAVVAAMIVVVQCNIRLLRRFEPRQILLGGIGLQIVAGLALLATVLLTGGRPPIEVWLGCMMVVIGASGLVTPNSAACYLEFFPRNAGSANAVYGSSLFISGGIVGGLVSSLQGDSLVPIALVFVIGPCVAVGFALSLAKAGQAVSGVARSGGESAQGQGDMAARTTMEAVGTPRLEGPSQGGVDS